MKKYRIIRSILIILVTCLTVMSCSIESGSINKDKIAYISVKEDKQYDKTFDELHLGNVYNYHLKLPQADKTWVTIWVEGYKNGEKMEPFHLGELSFGNNPNHVSEGPMGLGFINPQDEVPLLFIYSTYASTQPHKIENVLNQEGAGGSVWDFAIGKDEIGLESGETRVLGIYRQVKDSFRPYNPGDNSQITQMIDENMTVLLFKIKVELGDHP